MKKHVELVKKWLADPESVSTKELLANEYAAWDAYFTADSDEAAHRAAKWAHSAAAIVSDSYVDKYKQLAWEWVEIYETEARHAAN